MTPTRFADRATSRVVAIALAAMVVTLGSADDPAPLVHRSVPTDGGSMLWSPEALAARYEAL
jgi:hypothetical protein